MSTETTAALRRLGLLALKRRHDLNLSQDDVAAAGGPSTPTQTKIERGEASLRMPSSIRKIEAGYQWAPGSVRAILAGGDPRPVESEVDPDDEVMRAAFAKGITEDQRRRIIQILQERAEDEVAATTQRRRGRTAKGG